MPVKFKLNTLALVFMSLYCSLTQPVYAATGGAVEFKLEDFGIEVFQTDPKRQAEHEAEQIKERNDALPSYISPETLDADAALDAVNIDAPQEPSWEPIENEVSLTGFDSKECCLRAIRTTRYEVEAQCLNSGREIWNIESVPVKEATEKPIKSHKLCEIYHNEESKKQLETALKSEELGKESEGDAVEPEYYQCRARSQAKCFMPTGENAIFSSDRASEK